MDSRGFGFPFDREFDFNLHSSNSRLSSFARQEIKIVHRPSIMSGGAAGWEELGSLQPRSTGGESNTTGRGNDTTRGNSTGVDGANPGNSSAEGSSLNIGEPTEQPSSERTTLREENITVNNEQPLSTTVTNQGGTTTTARTRDQSRTTTTSQNLGATNQNLETTSQNLATPRQNANTNAPDVKPTNTESALAETPKAENEKGPIRR